VKDREFSEKIPSSPPFSKGGNERHLQTITFILSEDITHSRLDQVLAAQLTDYSRAKIQQWIKAGCVRIDDEIITLPKYHHLKPGQSITLQIEEQVQQPNWTAQSLDHTIEIIYQDESLIVINKPVGLVVHPGAGNPDQTLVNALLYQFPELQYLPRAGIIHRLDKETSGLLVVARTLAAHTYLVKQLQERLIKRDYLALVNGSVVGGATIETGFGRHPTQRTRMAVLHTSERRAVTHYRVQERFIKHTLLSVSLETGRTHQIRVHLAHIGFPILGDPLYAKGRVYFPPKADPQLIQTLQHFKRQALHAAQLALQHPLRDEWCVWTAPLPADFEQLLLALRQHDEKLD